MGDLTFSEGLGMLENSEYSPWLKTIFASIKVGTAIRGLRIFSHLTAFFVQHVLLRTEVARRKQKEHWDYSTQRVDRRLARTPATPDLWSVILAKSQGESGLTVPEYHSNSAIFMVAGTETTATALSGVTYHLLRNPATLARLTQELRSAFTSFADLSLDGLARCTFLMAVLHEGLRLYPPVPSALPRKVPAPGARICGRWVPGRTVVGAHHLSTYRNPALFRDPAEFHPERWLGEDDRYAADQLDALEPFSVGGRNCIGKNLAWHEMRLLLATVLLHFDLRLCDASLAWSDQRVFTLWEKKPLMCTLTPVAAAEGTA